MVEISRRSMGGSADGFLAMRHPVLAGGLAVGLVAILVVSADSVVDVRWQQAGTTWLALGIALCLALSWAWRRRAARAEDRRHAEAFAVRGVRRHHRYVPANKRTTLLTQDGRRMNGRIANISVAAVAIEAKLTDLDFMTVQRIGSREVGPIRRTPTGAVFAFKTFLEPQSFDKSFVL